MTFRLAIWDMDGTIVDSREVITRAMGRAFESLGLPAPGYEATRKTVGLSLDQVCGQLMPEGADPALLPQLVEAYKAAFVANRTEAGFVEPLYEGALEALERLKQDNWLIAMATGKSHRGIRAIFEMHEELPQYFDTIWCADDGPGKPHPFMVEQCMSAVGADTHQSLIIGDAIHDMVMGKNAGIRTLGVTWGFGQEDEFAGHADEVHHSFETLNESLAAFHPAPPLPLS